MSTYTKLIREGTVHGIIPNSEDSGILIPIYLEDKLLDDYSRLNSLLEDNYCIFGHTTFRVESYDEKGNVIETPIILGIKLTKNTSLDQQKTFKKFIEETVTRSTYPELYRTHIDNIPLYKRIELSSLYNKSNKGYLEERNFIH